LAVSYIAKVERVRAFAEVAEDLDNGFLEEACGQRGQSAIEIGHFDSQRPLGSSQRCNMSVGQGDHPYATLDG
jgi:hypothetical protein